MKLMNLNSPRRCDYRVLHDEVDDDLRKPCLTKEQALNLDHLEWCRFNVRLRSIERWFKTTGGYGNEKRYDWTERKPVNYRRRSRRARKSHKTKRSTLLPAKKGKFTSCWVSPTPDVPGVIVYRVHDPDQYWSVDDKWDTFINDTMGYLEPDWDYASLPPAYIDPVTKDAPVPNFNYFETSMFENEGPTFSFFEPEGGDESSSTFPNNPGFESGDPDIIFECEFEYESPKAYAKSRQWKRAVKRKLKKKPLPEKFAKFVPHSGEVDVEVLDSLMRFTEWRVAQPNQSEKEKLFYKRVEDLILTATKLTLCNDWRLAVLELFSYVKTFSDESVIAQATTHLVELFQSSQNVDFLREFKRCFRSQIEICDAHRSEFPIDVGSEFEAEAFDGNSVLEGCRSLMTGWVTASANPIFRKISYILSSCVTLGLCEASSVQWNIAGMRLFDVNCYQKHVNAADFITAIFETVVYFVEGGMELFTTGSFGAFLFSDKAIRELQDDFNWLRSNLLHVRTGNLRKFAGKTEAEYSCLLDKTLISVARLKKFAENHDRVMLSKIEGQLYDLKAQFQVLRKSGGIKKAPIVISIHGESGQGKSTISARLMIEIHRALGLPCEPQYFAYYNSVDEYDTGLNGNITGIFFDELGNTKPEFLQKVAYEFLMRANNNARSHAVLAQVEDKGQIEIAPDVIIITTNDKHLSAEEGSKEPVSVVRRADIHMHVVVREMFRMSATNNMIDPVKVKEYYKGSKPGSIQDIWEITLEEAYGKPNKVKGKPATVVFKALVDKEGELIQVGYKRALRYIIDFAKKKRGIQEELVRETNDLHNQIQLCDECGELEVLCECCQTCRPILSVVEPAPEQEIVFLDAQQQLEEEDEIKKERLRAIIRDNPVVVETVPDEDSGVDTRYGTRLLNGNFGRGKGISQAGVQRLIDQLKNTSRLPAVMEEEGGFYDYVPASVGRLATQFIGRRIFSRVKECCDGILINLVSKVDSQYRKKESSLVWCLINDYIDYTTDVRAVDHAYCEYRVLFAFLIALLLSSLTAWFGCYSITVLVLMFGLYWHKICMDYAYDDINRQRRNEILIKTVERIRKARVSRTLLMIGGFASAYYFLKKIMAWRKIVTPHGSLQPRSQADIDARDKEVNIWAEAKTEPLPAVLRQLDTATPQQVCNTIYKNLTVMSMDTPSGTTWCDALFLESNLVLIPHHMMFEKTITGRRLRKNMSVTFSRHGTDQVGGRFSCFIDSGNSYHIPNTDLVLVSVPNSGSYADITRLLPDKQFSGATTFLHKGLDGVKRMEGAHVTPAQVEHTYAQFSGYDTILENPTYKGLCMGVFVTTAKAPHIAGFHLGGEMEKTCRGIAGYMSRNQYLLAKQEVSAKKGIFIPNSGGDFPDKICGKPVLVSPEIHHRSPVNFLETSSCMRVFGSCLGGVTFVSRVVKSIASDAVARIMDQPNIWGPPRTDYKWRPWHTAMNAFTNASTGFLPSDVAWAVDDYIAPLLKLLERPEMKRMVRPLTPLETINGVPGERFVDKMKFTSAIGFPLTGAKANYMEPWPEEVPGYDVMPMNFTQEIWDEIKRNEECWIRGERAYTPVKAVLKDEPTKVTKEKMRVFYSMAIGAQYHLRRLTLGLTRFLQMNPFDAESMVGINCMGSEWQAVHEWFLADQFAPELNFGKNTSAGDYQAYDTKMPAQITAASISIYRRLLVASGNFTERDLLIFDGVCTEILFPIIAFNGTLIEVDASTISGHNLTVHINNTGNSLLKRVGFLNVELKPRNLVGKLTFRECERCGNYGDDCKSTINRRITTFWNMRTYRDFLAFHDMVFTMPDKTSEMVDFMDWESAEFLKRTDSFIPELGVNVGKLDEMSIFKSLHSNLKSDTLSPTEHVVACMEGAASEWFNYGEPIYTKRMQQLQQVAKELFIVVPGIMESFDSRVARWKARYQPAGTTILEITNHGGDEALDCGPTF